MTMKSWKIDLMRSVDILDEDEFDATFNYKWDGEKNILTYKNGFEYKGRPMKPGELKANNDKWNYEERAWYRNAGWIAIFLLVCIFIQTSGGN